MADVAANGSGRTPAPQACGWDHHYDALWVHVANTGHTPPAGFVGDGGIRLGAWVISQRSNHRAGRLDNEQIERLQRLPGWTWSVHRAAWQDNYLALLDFLADNGHVSPLVNYETTDGRRLGNWVRTQRARYHSRQLASERVERLEQLEGWTWSAHQAAWDANYSALLRFVDAGGHACPPVTFVAADGASLGGWVAKQRRAYRDGRLSPQRAATLEALPNWRWGGTRGQRPKGSPLNIGCAAPQAPKSPPPRR